MTRPFFDRLVTYYTEVGKALRGQASTAAIFPNASDVGTSREAVYAAALRQHLPSSCNVVFGGFLFGINGSESKQIDIIMTSGFAPKFNFLNGDGSGKTFACIEGCIGIVSVKSQLTTETLCEALDNVASIPEKQRLESDQYTPGLTLDAYPECPYKIVFAFNGILGATIQEGLKRYYAEHPNIPNHHRPSLIHVAGQYAIFRNVKADFQFGGDIVRLHDFYSLEKNPDVLAFANAVITMQQSAWTLQHVNLNYAPVASEAIRVALSSSVTRQ